VRLLLTGASGFLGKELYLRLKEQGHEVLGLSRHGPDLIGDVTERNLGLEADPHVDAIFHLAGIVDLGQRNKSHIWKVNVDGTHNVLSFCVDCNIPHLLFCSTAYTQGRNMYELSKQECEKRVDLFRKIHNLKVTVFKPSVIVANTRNFNSDGAQGLYNFAIVAAKVHHRLEEIRRKVEGALRFPPMRPVLRFKGDPRGRLNIIPVDTVANFMATHLDEGTFWVTNPDPPTLKEITSWVGRAILLDLRILKEFRPTPIEVLFSHLVAPFLPYLKGEESFHSDVEACPEVREEFIVKTVTQFVLGGG